MNRFQRLIFVGFLFLAINWLFLMYLTTSIRHKLTPYSHNNAAHPGPIIEQTEDVVNVSRSMPSVHDCECDIKPVRKKRVFLFSPKTIRYYEILVQVLRRIGCIVIYKQEWTHSKTWDILWSIPDPFTDTPSLMESLKPHQRVNHFPGNGFVTNKQSLATSRIKSVPKAFKLPADKDELLKYSELNPNQLFVQKDNGHKGVKITPLAEIDFQNPDIFIQRFVDRPYLIEGYLFDIGIFTAITSVNPLRLYMLDDWYIRFCSEPYYPFDANNTKKYVIETHTNMLFLDLPSINAYFTGNDTTRKDALLMVMKDRGVDTDRLELELIDTIRNAYLMHEDSIIESVEKYPNQRNNFELVRADFLLDEDLNVHLMEINMSPGITTFSHSSTIHKVFYEQMLFSFLNLVGVGGSTGQDFHQSNKGSQDMQVAGKNIRVYLDKCSSALCRNTCEPDVCKFCKSCLQSDEEDILMQSYNEHMSRNKFQRIFPKPFESVQAAKIWNHREDETYASLNAANKWMTLWYHGKCLKNAKWCT